MNLVCFEVSEEKLVRMIHNLAHVLYDLNHKATVDWCVYCDQPKLKDDSRSEVERKNKLKEMHIKDLAKAIISQLGDMLEEELAQQVVSLELAKELKENGYKQEG